MSPVLSYYCRMNTRHDHREEGVDRREEGVDRLAHELRAVWECRELLGQRGEAGSVGKDGSSLQPCISGSAHACYRACVMGGLMHESRSAASLLILPEGLHGDTELARWLLVVARLASSFVWGEKNTSMKRLQKGKVFDVLTSCARSRSCFSCTLARATDGRGDRRGRDEMHLSDEDAYSDYDDDQHDEPRATWGASPRARKAADKNLFANRAEPALVADLRGGEPLGANVLLFSSESTATSSISSFEEQEDGSMALALNVRHRPATPRNAPDRPAAPRSFSYSLPWYSPCPARCCRFAPRVQLAEHLLIKMPSIRPWQLEKDGRLHRCGGLARARAWNPFPRARAIRRPRKRPDAYCPTRASCPHPLRCAATR